MLKKLSGILVLAAMLISFAALPAQAAVFSSDNWVQYEKGFFTSSDDFAEYFTEYTDTDFGNGQLTAVRMVATSTKTLTKNRNPVSYKIGDSSSHYGEHINDKAAYAHMRVYVATFSDQWRNCFDYFQMRMDKDGTGASRDTWLFDTYEKDGGCVSEVYPTNYKSEYAYVTLGSVYPAHQGKLGCGPADSGTADSNTRELSDSDYDKFDIIMEYNKQGGATSYVFINGVFSGCYYDSGLTDKHFHGIVFRVLQDKKIRGNSDYIAVKFDSDRIGHREYYNTDDYYVTLEDVMQDAGLGDDIDSTMMYKTSNIQNYMPGADRAGYIYNAKGGDTERRPINRNITYSGNTAEIAVTNTDTSNYELAANMIAGIYGQNPKFGVSYESYHPRAKYIKLSFDQTISNDGMWLEYQTFYSGPVQAMQMWNNGGYLVVGVKGSGKNITCDGTEGHPTAEMTATNHIDWIIEPVVDFSNESNTKLINHVFVNGEFLSSGTIDNQYAQRICDIILNTKSAAGTVTIDNWSMTVYNETADFDSNAVDYEITHDDGVDKIAVSVKPGKIEGYTPGGDAYVITAVFDGGKLLDIAINTDVTDGVCTNTFNYTQDMDEIKAFVWNISDAAVAPQTRVVTVSIG